MKIFGRYLKQNASLTQLVQRRALQQLLLMSAPLFLGACHPWLSSQGETHSPYRPDATHGVLDPTVDGTNSHTTPSPLPSTTPPVISRPDKDTKLDGLDLLKDYLEVKFQSDLEISQGISEGPDHQYQLRIQDGDFASLGTPQSSDKLIWTGYSKFSCVIHYFKTGEVAKLFFAKGTTIHLHPLFEAKLGDDGKQEDVTFRAWTQPVDGVTNYTVVTTMTCQGLPGDMMNVNSLIEAFGQNKVGDVSTDIVDIRVHRGNEKPIKTGPHPVLNTEGSGLSSAVQSGSLPSRGLASEAKAADGTGTTQIRAEKSDLQGPSNWREARPSFGVQFSGSPGGLGGSTISPAQQGVKSQAFLLQGEYQPSFLQSFGVFSIGPSIGVYPTAGTVKENGSRVTTSYFSLYEIGAQFRYQFRYLQDQLLVPFASYDYQSLSYRINNGGAGRLNIAGGSAGFSLFLNRLAPTQAKEFYESMGVARSYLVAELKNLSGSDANVKVSGNSYFLGFRCEF